MISIIQYLLIGLSIAIFLKLAKATITFKGIKDQRIIFVLTIVCWPIVALAMFYIILAVILFIFDIRLPFITYRE